MTAIAAPATACRALTAGARFASLATVARDPQGWPFATLVAVAFDAQGRPLLLLSHLAEHTKNLLADPRASLLVADAENGDPLAAGRMTVVGRAELVPEDERTATREAFLAIHPNAASYVTFGDFAMWRIDVSQVRWVGGFDRMTWIAGADYSRA